MKKGLEAETHTQSADIHFPLEQNHIDDISISCVHASLHACCLVSYAKEKVNRKPQHLCGPVFFIISKR